MKNVQGGVAAIDTCVISEASLNKATLITNGISALMIFYVDFQN